MDIVGTWETLPASWFIRIFADNPQRRECRNGLQGVGLIRSRGVAG